MATITKGYDLTNVFANGRRLAVYREDEGPRKWAIGEWLDNDTGGQVLTTIGTGYASQQEAIDRAAEMVDEAKVAEPVLWTVSVDTEGRVTEWNDLLVVVAADEDEAKRLAVAWVEDHRGEVTVLGTVEAYRYAGPARVMGPLDLDN